LLEKHVVAVSAEIIHSGLPLGLASMPIIRERASLAARATCSKRHH